MATERVVIIHVLLALSLLILTERCICTTDDGVSDYNIKHDEIMHVLAHRHNPNVIPLARSQQPLNVSVTLFLLDILEVDIDSNQVEFLVYLSREYRSESLAWDTGEYGLDSVRVPRDFVWSTDVTFHNDIGSASHQPSPPAMVVVKHDGTVSLTDKLRVRTLCQVYALSDRHAAQCPVRVASQTHDRSLLWLNAPTEATPNAMLFSDTSKYILVNMTARKDTLHLSIGSYEEMVFTITFGRITPP